MHCVIGHWFGKVYKKNEGNSVAEIYGGYGNETSDLFIIIYLFKFKVCSLELVFILQGATARPYKQLLDHISRFGFTYAFAVVYF